MSLRPLLFLAATLSISSGSAQTAKSVSSIVSNTNCHLNNDEFSVQVTRTQFEPSRSLWRFVPGQAQQPRRISDNWRVFWKMSELAEGKPNAPAKSAYLGHFESNPSPGNSTPLQISGLDLDMLHYTGDMRGMLWKGNQYLSPKLPVASVPEYWAKTDFDGLYPCMLCRSHQHFFEWKPSPVIRESNSFATVKVVPPTPAFGKFRALADQGMKSPRLVLTDDLRYLMSIPHNGGDPKPGFNHYKAWCYDLAKDEFTEHCLHFGAKLTRIDQVESVDGRLLFLVGNELDELAIVDPDSKMVADLSPISQHARGAFLKLFWDYHNKHVMVLLDRFNTSLRLEHEIQILDFAYATSTARKLTLQVSGLSEP